VVDLDAPPGDRWNHVVAAYKDQLPAVVAMADDILGTGMGATIATSAFATAANVGWVYYSEELAGIAKATGIPLGRVVLLQIAYEAFAACTSIVVDGPDGHPLHIRTMDWEMPELQPLTIEVDFIKGGVLVHRATTWAGYVGVLTGVRVQGFSVSVNYRRSLEGKEDCLVQCCWRVVVVVVIVVVLLLCIADCVTICCSIGTPGAQEGIKGILHNLKRGMAGHWPVSFLVREVLETEDNYHDAVKALQQSELMAPVYLTIAGVSPGEGCVLTRDREAAVVDGGSGTTGGITGGTNGGGVTEQLGNGTTVVVQTNMDIPLCDMDDTDDDWQDICASRVRRRFAKAALRGLGEGGGRITMDGAWLSWLSWLVFGVVIVVVVVVVVIVVVVVVVVDVVFLCCSVLFCGTNKLRWICIGVVTLILLFLVRVYTGTTAVLCCIVQICGNWSVLRHVKRTTPCIQRVWCRERVNWSHECTQRENKGLRAKKNSKGYK
jgi:hypothetical protein